MCEFDDPRRSVKKYALTAIGVVVLAIANFMLAAATGGEQISKPAEGDDLRAAAQNASLLLERFVVGSDCSPLAYEVRPLQTGDETIYLVVMHVDNNTCDRLLPSLNRDGSRYKLRFASEKKLPAVVDPQADPAPDWFDYTLIHEIDPATEINTTTIEE